MTENALRSITFPHDLNNMKIITATTILTFQIFLKYTVYRPKDCSDVKAEQGIARDGEYILFPPRLLNEAVTVFCYNMKETPKSFITLSRHNIAKHPDKYCDGPPPGPLPYQPAETVFRKIAILMDTMEVVTDDFTFATTRGGQPIPYAVARDCFVAHKDNKKHKCGLEGYFQIDLRNTDFVIKPSTKWKTFGKSTYKRVARFTVEYIVGQCGGFCGGCKPDGKLFVERWQVNGGWGPWQVEIEVNCSVTCGEGRLYVKRFRECDNPAPQRGGRNCLGNSALFSVENCNMVDCPVDGGWTSWIETDIGDCSVTCDGPGSQQVTLRRRCINPPQIGAGKPCEGLDLITKTQTCDPSVDCPVDGGWSSWSETHRGDCSVTCDGPGSLQVTLSRKCTNPSPKHGGKPCEGSDLSTKTQTCDPNVDCPVDGAWSSWLQHNGDCSVTCESGVRSVTLNRTCTNPKPQFNGKPCEGEDSNTLTEVCEVNVQCPVDRGWSSWSETHRGDCSVTCDGPGSLQITLSRTCTNPPQKGAGKSCEGSDLITKTQTCDPKVDCPVDGEWSSWVQHNGDCSVTCESGVRSVTLNRTCTNPKPQLNGKPCEGEERNILTEVCEVNVQCPVHGQWSSWTLLETGICNKMCNRSLMFEINCDNPEPQHGGNDCEGRNQKTVLEPCTGENCTDGNWASWTTYVTGNCTDDCIHLVTLRRTCTNPAPGPRGKHCNGSNEKSYTESCSGGSCAVSGGPDLILISVIIVSLFILLCLISVILYYYSRRRKKKQKPQIQIDDFGKYIEDQFGDSGRLDVSFASVSSVKVVELDTDGTHDNEGILESFDNKVITTDEKPKDVDITDLKRIELV